MKIFAFKKFYNTESKILLKHLSPKHVGKKVINNLPANILIFLLPKNKSLPSIHALA